MHVLKTLDLSVFVCNNRLKALNIAFLSVKLLDHLVSLAFYGHQECLQIPIVIKLLPIGLLLFECSFKLSFHHTIPRNDFFRGHLVSFVID